MSKGWAYVGRTSEPSLFHPDVGTVVGAVVDDPQLRKDLAETVSEWIIEGLTIERVPAEWVRQNFGTAEPYLPSRESRGG